MDDLDPRRTDMTVVTAFHHSIASWLRARFPLGTPAYVLPLDNDPGAVAGTLAGMSVRRLSPDKWPFPALMWQRLGAPDPSLLLNVQYTQFHDDLRDKIAADLQKVGNVVVKEVTLRTTIMPARADADMLVKPTLSGKRVCMWEIKTRQFSDLSPNQSYVYALGLIGGHVRTDGTRVSNLGLPVNTPLPQMDFCLITCAGPGRRWYPFYVPADDVDTKASTAALVARMQALRNAPLIP